MTQAEKLEALYKKAKGNGWNDEPWWSGAHVAFDDAGFEASGDWYSCMTILFRHSFALALFGDERQKYQGYNLMTGKLLTDEEKAELPQPPPKYLLELQQAVISDDPIDYMYQEAIVKSGIQQMKDNYGEAVFGDG